jgi:hypothetical protein
VGNNPINRIDPWGLTAEEIGGIPYGSQEWAANLGSDSNDNSIQQAIQDNLDFSEPGSKCDKFTTIILEDAGKKPDDWPNPDSTKVGPNEDKLPNYIAHYENETNDNIEEGTNVIMMEGKHPDEHMIIVDYDEDSNPPITGAHYSGGEVEELEYNSQEELEAAFIYDTFHYLLVD